MVSPTTIHPRFQSKGSLGDLVRATHEQLKVYLPQGTNSYYIVFGTTLVQVSQGHPLDTFFVNHGVQHLITQGEATMIVCGDGVGRHNMEQILKLRAKSQGMPEGYLPWGWESFQLSEIENTAYRYTPPEPLQETPPEPRY